MILLKSLLEDAIPSKITKEILTFQSSLIDQGWDDVDVKFIRGYNQRIVEIDLEHNDLKNIKLIGYLRNETNLIWEGRYYKRNDNEWNDVPPYRLSPKETLPYCEAYLKNEELRLYILKYQIQNEDYISRTLKNFRYFFDLKDLNDELVISVFHRVIGHNYQFEYYSIRDDSNGSQTKLKTIEEVVEFLKNKESSNT